MPTSQNSPLSYQTTMPEYPDVSYENWVRSYDLDHAANINGDGSAGRLSHSIGAWANGYPDYKTWRQSQLDQYNAAMSAYNTWLQTGEGQRASLESGDYNASYFSGQSASASPLSYESVEPRSGFSEMASGVVGLMSMIKGLQGLSLVSQQIRGAELANKGAELKNEGQAIENQWKGKLLGNKYILGGYQADKQQLLNQQQLYSMFKDLPETWTAGGIMHYGQSDYDLNQMDKSLGYQRAVADLNFLQAGTALRNAQEKMAHWSVKEKKWYSKNIWSIQKQLLEGQLTYLNGEINFQKVDQQLRKAGKIAGIATDVINTTVNAVKTFVPMFKPLDAIGNAWVPWNPNNSWTPNVDRGTGEFYGTYGW